MFGSRSLCPSKYRGPGRLRCCPPLLNGHGFVAGHVPSRSPFFPFTRTFFSVEPAHPSPCSAARYSAWTCQPPIWSASHFGCLALTLGRVGWAGVDPDTDAPALPGCINTAFSSSHCPADIVDWPSALEGWIWVHHAVHIALSPSQREGFRINVDLSLLAHELKLLELVGMGVGHILVGRSPTWTNNLVGEVILVSGIAI